MNSPIPSPAKDERGKERKAAHSVPLKSVALPAEHGSWSLVSEPILLGLLVAPSWAGLSFAVAAFALFLFNRPFKIFWVDRRRGRTYERTSLAWRFMVIYGCVALGGSVVALALMGWQPFVPFVLAAPLIAVFSYFDQRPGRFWQAELAAPVSFAAVTSSIVLAGGMTWPLALALWGFMVARAVPAILFIRARLRLDKGKAAGAGVVIIAHGLALVEITVLAWAGWLPFTAVIAAVILMARAVWGLSVYRWGSSAKALGFLETGFGLLSVLLVAMGFWWS